jgi:Bacteriocin-protection, YdeI or OmpD-Associated
MSQSIAQKLRIKEGMRLLTLHAPGNFPASLAPLPAGVKISAKGAEYDQVHWFVRGKAKVEQETGKVVAMLKPDIVCWIYYPKGSSGIQTDLTRDKGWESLLKLKGLQWLSLISFDETWSAFGMRRSTDTLTLVKRHTQKAAERPILEYIDPATKTVRLPEDLEQALKSGKSARVFFDSLSYTNKKEYVEWIVTAKRDATRTERVEGTVERLNKKWKNPRNL